MRLHPANDDEERNDERRNLLDRKKKDQQIRGLGNLRTYNRTPDTDPDRQLRLVLHGHPDGCHVFRGISDDGEEYQTDEWLGNVVSRCGFFNGCDHFEQKHS